MNRGPLSYSIYKLTKTKKPEYRRRAHYQVNYSEVSDYNNNTFAIRKSQLVWRPPILGHFLNT